MMRFLAALLCSLWLSIGVVDADTGAMLLGVGTDATSPLSFTTVCQGTDTANTATVACTGTVSVAAGETLVAAVTNGGARLLSSFSDGTNSYTIGSDSQSGGGTPSAAIAYFLNPAAVGNGATYTATLAAANTIKSIQVWKLNRTAAALVSSGVAHATSTAPSCTTSLPVTTGSEVFGVVAAVNPITQASGIWVTPADQNVTITGSNNAIDQHGITTSTATQNYAVTITSANWACAIVGLL